MQKQSQSPDYPSVDDASNAAALEAAATNGHHSVLDPYKPPGVPHGLPHVVNFATISSMNLPIQIRFLIIMLARFANYDGVASVAVSTLCETCEIGSKNTVERWLGLAAQVGILRKEPNRGGQDRKSNSYTFLGKERNWVPLPVGHPETVTYHRAGGSTQGHRAAAGESSPGRRPGNRGGAAEGRTRPDEERRGHRSPRGDQWG